MFLQVSVCPQGGRVSASVHAGMPSPPGTRQNPPRPGRPPGPGRTPPGPGRPPGNQADTPQDQTHPPGTRQTPPLGPDRPPRTRQTPPPLGSRLQHTVYYERPVRILLECILVKIKICQDFLMIFMTFGIFSDTNEGPVLDIARSRSLSSYPF